MLTEIRPVNDQAQRMRWETENKQWREYHQTAGGQTLCFRQLNDDRNILSFTFIAQL
jgi:hypothetical protein